MIYVEMAMLSLDFAGNLLLMYRELSSFGNSKMGHEAWVDREMIVGFEWLTIVGW